MILTINAKGKKYKIISEGNTVELLEVLSQACADLILGLKGDREEKEEMFFECLSYYLNK